MNSQQIRELIALPLISHRTQAIFDFLKMIAQGGWEAWLQVELALRFIDYLSGDKLQFSREQSYPGKTIKYDLKVTGNKGANLYFEIKTQNNAEDSSTAKRLGEDIDKILSLNSSFRKENVVIAFAVSGMTNLKEIENLQNLLLSAKYAGHLKAYDLKGEVIEPKKLVDFENKLCVFWYSIDK